MNAMQRDKIEMAFEKVLEVVRASQKGGRNYYLMMYTARQQLKKALDEATEKEE